MLSANDIKLLEKKFATKEDLVNFKDAILHEILAMRQELAIIIGYRDQIDEHEVRIEKLKNKSKSN